MGTLSKKYKVEGIPCFVILGPDGKLIIKDGSEAVRKDPTGIKFPWIPPTPAEKTKITIDILGPDLLAKAAGKHIGLYFSAHWCPPCRGFTPKLAEFYNNGLKDKMEIIFISSDRDQASFDDYFKEMPWLALDYSKREEKAALSEAMGVEGIPTFAVINPDGTIVTTDGKSKVGQDPKAETFPEGWLPQPFNDVNDDPSPLNEEKCIIACGDAEIANAAVKSVALEHYAKAGKDVDAMAIRFFKGPDGGAMGQLRKMTGVVGNKLILLDIPDDGAYYTCDADSITTDVVRKFIADVEAKTVERKRLEK